MYINTQFLSKIGLKLIDILPLQLIKQNVSKDSDYSKEVEAYLGVYNSKKRLTEKGMLTSVKPKRKSDTEYDLLRLTKKGKETLKMLEIADLTEEDYIMREELIKIYEALGHKIGNKQKLIRDIVWFRSEVVIDNELMLKAVKAYLDHCEEYVPNLENLFWKPSNLYSLTQKLSESRFYQFVEEKLNIL